MSNWSKSAIYGGIYTNTQNQINCSSCDARISCKYYKLTAKIEDYRRLLEKAREKVKKALLYIKDNLKVHFAGKQELYWPVLISAVLLALVFVSQIAFAETGPTLNNLPLEDGSKMNLIEFAKKNELASVGSASVKKIAEEQPVADKGSDTEKNALKQDVAGIVKNTPMAAMVDPIAERDRTVAAFIVGIAMKESKFGVYSPKLGGRDCYNYWGFKGGGKTVAGGYSCFASPDEAVDAVGGKIEKLVARGVKSPAQMIGWKCGSSCAGHGQANVQKWISDVAINFYKINS